MREYNVHSIKEWRKSLMIDTSSTVIMTRDNSQPTYFLHFHLVSYII